MNSVREEKVKGTLNSSWSWIQLKTSFFLPFSQSREVYSVIV
jgi:hypothetical protein